MIDLDPPLRKGFRLTTEGEDRWANYRHNADCSCHLNPPCGWCTSEDHPRALELEDEVWEPDLPDFLSINKEFSS